MYLHMLCNKELDAFLRIAQELLNVDGEYSDSEKKAMDLILSQFNKTQENIVISLNDAISVISQQKARMISLVELVGLAYVDSSFCDKEKEFLTKLTQTWNIDKETYQHINEWVIQLVNIDLEITDLLEKEL